MKYILTLLALVATTLAQQVPVNLQVDRNTGVIIGAPNASLFRTGNAIVTTSAISLQPKTFANSTARLASVPTAVGQIGLQLDTGALYRSTATTAGAWTVISTGGGGSSGNATWADDAARATLAPTAAGQLGMQLDTNVIYRSTGTAAGDWSPNINLGGVLQGITTLNVSGFGNFTDDLNAAQDLWVGGNATCDFTIVAGVQMMAPDMYANSMHAGVFTNTTGLLLSGGTGGTGDVDIAVLAGNINFNVNGMTRGTFTTSTLTLGNNIGISFAGTGAATTRTNLGLSIGTNVQAYDPDLTTYAGITPSANVQTLLGAANYAAFKTSLSLNNVENTALSTWVGTTNITTLGTITSGVWGGSAIPVTNGGTGLTAVPTNGQIPIGNGTTFALASITGTSNQVTVTNGSGSITLSLPQSIHTGASPTFTGLNLSGLTASQPVATDASKNLVSVVSWSVPQGGTGATSLTGILKGNGTSAFTAVTAPTGTIVGTSDTQTLTAKIVSRSAALGTDDTYEGHDIIGLNNSGGVTQWDAVYLNSSSQWVLADADGTNTYPCRGIVSATASTGNASTVVASGTVRNDAWNWTPGGTVYLSTTAGGLTQTAPTASGSKVQVIGFALTADILYVNPSLDIGTNP